MKIAIDVADLDCERIDGTRVYIKNVLKYLGKLSSEDEFFLFHKKDYNESLQPVEFENYVDRKIGKGFWWTQVKFARALRKLQKEKCDNEKLICWMPIQQIPFLQFIKSKVESQKSIGYVVTIHDLAFKFFPKHFPLIDRLKINFYTDIAIKKADKIIAISEATKKDIIKLYPKVDANKIQVVYHGFDRENFRQEFNEKEVELFLRKYDLVQSAGDNKSLKFESKVESRKSKVESRKSKVESRKSKVESRKSKVTICDNKAGDYLLYVGAIQPRKDLVTLIKSFEFLKRSGKYNKLKLVLAGEIAWKSGATVRAVKISKFKDDIIMTGKVGFKELALFYSLAKVFVFPSLYEGFGIPLLEAMATKTPVVTADNSSLGEVGGEAVLKFKSDSVPQLTRQIARLLDSEELQQEMVKRGLVRIEKFSWEKCAKETLKALQSF